MAISETMWITLRRVNLVRIKRKIPVKFGVLSNITKFLP